MTTVKERPILFKGEMVRAILDGRKTQARRVLDKKYWPVDDYVDLSGAIPETRGKYEFLRLANGHEFGGPIRCPFGQPGDRLWVRESFQPLWTLEAVEKGCANYETGEGYRVRYPATEEPVEWYDMVNERLTFACRPSIHMPRWASRILLEVVSVRVERLQDITEGDAIAEGLGNGDQFETHKDEMRCLWDSLAAPGAAWADNPWVWAVEFKRVEGQS